MSPRLCVSAGDLPPAGSHNSQGHGRFYRNAFTCMGPSRPRRRGVSGVLDVFGGWYLVLAGAPLGGGLDPWFVPPFQGLDGWWAGQPGALPRAGVCRAVGAHEPCKASHVWVHRVHPLLDSNAPPPFSNPPMPSKNPFSPMSPRLCVSAGDLSPNRFPQPAKEPMLFGLHAGSQGMQAGLHWLEGTSRRLKAGEHFLEPGRVGLEAEEQALKAEELFFEEPESGLREMRRSLQQAALGMDASAWRRRRGCHTSERRKVRSLQRSPKKSPLHEALHAASISPGPVGSGFARVS